MLETRTLINVKVDDLETLLKVLQAVKDIVGKENVSMEDGVIEYTTITEDEIIILLQDEGYDLEELSEEELDKLIEEKYYELSKKIFGD